MTTDMMNIRNLVEQAPDGLCEMNGFAAERLMEVKVGAVTGAAVVEERLPRPGLGLRLGLGNARRCGRAAHPELAEGHRASSKTAVIEEAYVHGISTCSVHDLVKAKGMSRIRKCRVSRRGEEIDGTRAAALPPSSTALSCRSSRSARTLVRGTGNAPPQLMETKPCVLPGTMADVVEAVDRKPCPRQDRGKDALPEGVRRTHRRKKPGLARLSRSRSTPH